MRKPPYDGIAFIGVSIRRHEWIEHGSVCDGANNRLWKSMRNLLRRFERPSSNVVIRIVFRGFTGRVRCDAASQIPSHVSLNQMHFPKCM